MAPRGIWPHRDRRLANKPCTHERFDLRVYFIKGPCELAVILEVQACSNSFSYDCLCSDLFPKYTETSDITNIIVRLHKSHKNYSPVSSSRLEVNYDMTVDKSWCLTCPGGSIFSINSVCVANLLLATEPGVQRPHIGSRSECTLDTVEAWDTRTST